MFSKRQQYYMTSAPCFKCDIPCWYWNDEVPFVPYCTFCKFCKRPPARIIRIY